MYSENNITIEYRYDTDLIQYTKEEFKNYYGTDYFLSHWDTAPEYIIDQTEFSNEKRYDTDLIRYTKQEFIDTYGIDNYYIHWALAPGIISTTNYSVH